MFDPEKVERFIDADARHDQPSLAIYVIASDYDQLLALYRASLVPNVKFWPCEEGNHLGCAVKKLIECGCECHKHHE